MEKIDRMNYQQALDKIMAVPMFQNVGASAFNPTLDGINRLVEPFNNPHNSYPTIHIAGTNGKGSVTNMLSSVLIESGYKVGCYTSPHLLDYRERVRINGAMIEEGIVIDFVERVAHIIDSNTVSFFEITTALAFYAFMVEKVDIAVIEVGLGGLTDSTNIITPILSVITNIAFDHKNILGDSITEIATQKGGIIKPNIPVVIGERNRESDMVFDTLAKECGSPITYAEDLYSVMLFDSDSGSVIVNHGIGQYTLALTGECQQKNFVTLLAAIDKLIDAGLSISNDNIAKGVSSVCHNMNFMGRWQKIAISPLTICDTGHNRAGIESIVKQLKRERYDKLYIVIGFMADKEIDDILSLLPIDAYYLFVTASNPRSMLATDLIEIAQKRGLVGEAYDTVGEGYAKAQELATEHDMIFIGGSTFIVADLLKG